MLQPSQRPPDLGPQYRGMSSLPSPRFQTQPGQYHATIVQLQQQEERVQHALGQRQQQLSQQQNLQNHQLNSQAAASNPTQAVLYQATQATAGLVPSHPIPAVQISQNIQPMPQVRQIQQVQQGQQEQVQQTQPMGSPNLTRNGARHEPTQVAQPSQPGGLQRHSYPQAKDPLIPPPHREITRPEYPHDASDRKALMMSLHQAHVRSPKRFVKDGETERFYQAVKSLSVGPAPVPPKNIIYEFHFEVTDAQLACAATKSKTSGGLLPVVEHFSGALRWRIRCCVAPTSVKMPSEQEWAILDANWPPNIFMTLNGQALDVRRHPHNGKDLPTDITDFVVCGNNVIKLGLPDPQCEKPQNRFVAVEVVETVSHSSVLESVWARGLIPKEVTLNTIKQRLTSPPDDDCVVFEEPDLSIDLADPFSATIFKVPARGVACTHMECFDLETWLNTRPAKPLIRCAHTGLAGKCSCANTAEPSNPDKWRCPICSMDARPSSLRIDGFLLAVRQQLEEEGKLQTKNMRVTADGSWSVLVEADDQDSDEEGAPVTVTATMAAKKSLAAAPAAATVVRRPEIEIIEID